MQDIFSQKREERAAFIERTKEDVARATDRIVEFLQPEKLKAYLKDVPVIGGNIYVEHIPGTYLDDMELAERAIRGVPYEVLAAAGKPCLSGWSAGVSALWTI